ncbi:MAG: hypothetical protein AAGC55_27945 [Myxococcota bacterium]
MIRATNSRPGQLAALPVLLAGLALGLAPACGGKNKNSSEQLMASDGDRKVPLVDPSLCETEGKQVTTFDLNRDNQPDVWKLFKQIDEGGTRLSVLSCKQIDYNHDGKKDYVVGYDNKGGKLFEQMDHDFDGRFDAFYQYNSKTGKVAEAQYESGFDGRYDLQTVYDESGAIKSIRGDRNGDGEPDVWEQYIEGELVAILYDDDYDNKVDRREEIKVKQVSEVPGPDERDSEDPELSPDEDPEAQVTDPDSEGAEDGDSE